MSLSGQWIAKYSGTNTGTGVIDIDEFDDHFSGTVTAWDEHPALPSSLARIRTSSKSAMQHLTNLPVTHIDAAGTPLSADNIKRLSETNIFLPATVDIDFRLNGSTLSIQWSSSIGTSGAAVATAPKTRASLRSAVVATPVKGWDGFKRIVNAIGQKRYIFRGQTNNKWRLRISFHRTGRADLERYSTGDIPDLLRAPYLVWRGFQ
jgi:hypothetical protein